MNSYEPLDFRPVFGAAAFALAALTMVLTVGVPARIAPAGSFTVPAAAHATRVATEVTIEPARIEVIGVRETDIAASPARTQPSST